MHLATIGDHLRGRRMDLRLSLVAAAARLGVDRTTLITWEVHGVRPNFAYWPPILDFLGYDPYPEPRGDGELLAWLRRRNGEELPACAERIGVSANTLRRWEEGGAPETARGRYRLRIFLAYERARLGLPPTFGGS